MTYKRQTRCVDCNGMGRETDRPAMRPGPRCEEHHREEKRRRSKVNHGKRVEATYGITEEQYWVIYEAQGGRCYVCRWATGKRKRLAVDHDHNKGCGHDSKVGCLQCVRCLACGPCNKILGMLDIGALRRAIDVLRTDRPTPAQRMLRRREILNVY